jgi:hypothetical protein
MVMEEQIRVLRLEGTALEHNSSTASPDDLGCRDRHFSAVLLQGLTDPRHPQELDLPGLGKLPHAHN